MKMDRKRYLGALKYKEDKARARVASPFKDGKGAMENELEEGRVPGVVKEKIRVFDPSDKEKEALGNSSP